MNGLNERCGRSMPGHCRHSHSHNHCHDHDHYRGSQGMVAVVRGLRDAGLAVTLTDDRGLETEVGQLARRLGDHYIVRDNQDPLSTPKKSSSTQTRGLEDQRTLPFHTTSPFHTTFPYLQREIEDRYISTYQAAHGMSSSFSAPIRAECSLPRIDPVAGRNFMDSYRPSYDSFPPVRDLHSSRHAVALVDRGPTLSMPMPYCPRDAFAASLRKYPLIPPERSTSADLIHRLLTYTHTCNLTKSSYHSKSLRSLRHSPEVTRELRNLTKKVSKNVQTYTRGRHDSPQERDSERRENVNVRKRRRDDDSPGNYPSNRSSRYDDETTLYAYDYLKAPYCIARAEMPPFRLGQHDRSHLSVVGSSLIPHNTSVEGTTRSSVLRTETTPRGSPVRRDASTIPLHIHTGMTPRSSIIRTETTPRSSPVRTEITPRASRARTEMTPRSSPIRTQTTPRSSPVRADMTARSSTARTEMTPRSSPICMETSPSSSPIRKTSPRSSPVRTEGLRVTRDGYRVHKSEVRYLNDVSRYVRDAIRQIYEDQPQTCPHISSRYSQHRREFHRNGPAVPDWSNMESQTSPGQSRDSPSHSRADSINITPQTSKSCNICHKPLPCGCSRPKRIRFHSPNICKNLIDACDLPQDEDEEIDDMDYVNRKIEDVIYDWLQEIPVYASYSPSDRCQRERAITALITGITQNYGTEDFEKIARAEILQCLTQLPMWYPNKKDKNDFRREHAEKLIRKLKNVKSKRDKFGEQVAKWFKQLRFKPTHDGKLVDKRKILKELTKELRKIAMKKLATEEEYHNLIKEEAYVMIEKMPLQVEGNRTRANQKLTDGLVDRLSAISFKDVKKKLDYEPQNEFEWEILDWIEDLPEFTELTEGEGKNAIKRLAKKLKELRSKGLKFEEVYEEMETAINDWVQYLQERQPLDLEFELQQDILAWMELFPELAADRPSDKNENEAFAKKLAEKLNILQKEGIEDEIVQDQMLSEIKGALGTVIEKKGKWIEVKERHRLALNLLENLENRIEKQKKRRHLPRLFKKKIQKWFNDIPALAGGSIEEKQEIDQITQNLANDLYRIQTKGVNDNTRNEMLEKIKDVYDLVLTKRNVTFTPKQKKKTSEKLLKKILKLIKNVQNDLLPEKFLNERLINEIIGMIESYPQFSNQTSVEKQEIENTIKNTTRIIAMMVMEGIQDEHVQQAMTDEIKYLLDQIKEIKHVVIDENTKSEIVDKILENILTSISKMEKSCKLPTEYQKHILSWLNNIDELSNTSVDNLENEKISIPLAKRLIEIQDRGFDDEAVRDQMRDEIQNRLEQALDKRGKQLSPRAKNKYIGNLMSQLIKLSKNSLKCSVATKEKQVEFEKDIIDWLDEIPQLTSHTPEEKLNNLHLSQDLAKNLNILQHEGLEDDEVRDDMLNEIKSYLDLGMEKRGQNVMDPRDKEEFAEQLLDKIVHKTELIESQKSLPRHIEIDILKWIENIPELKSSSPTDKKQNEIMARKLTQQVIKLKSKGISDEVFEESTIGEIKSTLDALLEKKGEHVSPKARQTLANTLFNNILSVIKNAEKGQLPTKKMQKEVQRDISEWLQDIPELMLTNESHKKDIERMVPRLTKNILNLKSEGINDEQVQQHIINDIKDELHMILEKSGDHMDSKEKLDLAEKLFDKVITTADKHEKELKLPNLIQNDVLDWIENIPELASNRPSEKTENEQLARSLAKNIHKLFDKLVNKKELRKELSKIIKTALDLALEKKIQQLSPSTKNKLVENLVEKIIRRKHQTHKASVPTKAIEKEFKEDIEAWMYDIPQIPEGKQRNELIQKLAKDLNKIQIDAIQDDKVQKRMLESIKTNLEDTLQKTGMDMSEDQEQKLAEGLLATLTTTSDSTSKKQQLVTDLQKDIHGWIDDIPELATSKPSEKNYNEEMSHKLAKKLHDMHAKGLDDQSIRDQMIKEIKIELNSSLERKGETMSPTAKNKLAEKLFENLSKTVDNSENIQVPNRQVEKTFQNEITQWMEDIPELNNKGLLDKEENEEFTNKMSQRLTQLQVADIDDYTIREEMLEELQNGLETLLESKGESMNTSTKKKLTNKLLNNLIGAMETEKVKVGKKHVDDKVKRDLKNWIEDIEELDTVNNFEKQKLNQSLENTIKNFKGKDMQDAAVREAAINELKEKLESGLGKKKMDDKTKTDLAERLLEKTSETASKYGKRYENINLFYSDIMEWFQSIPETSKNSPSEEKQLENISRALSQRITALMAMGIEHEETRCQILSEIKDNLDNVLEMRGKEIEPSDKTQLCENLLSILIKTVEKNKLRKKPIALNETLENELKNEITNWMLDNPSIPFDKSDRKAIDEISAKLAKKMNKMHAEGVPFQVIKAEMIQDISKDLGDLCEKKGIKLDSIQRKHIAENLFDSMSKSIKNKHRQLATATKETGILNPKYQEEIQNELTDWILDNPDLPFDSSDSDDIKTISGNLTKKMNILQSEGMTHDEIKSAIIGDIMKDLDDLCEKKGIKLDPKKKREIAENMYKKNSESMKNKQEKAKSVIKSESLGLQLEKELQNEITNLILNNPDLPFDSSDLKDIEKVSAELSHKFNELQAQGIPDEQMKNILMNDIRNNIDKLCEAKGIKIDPKTRDKLVESLYNNMKRSDKEKKIKQYERKEYDYLVSGLINDIPELYAKTTQEKRANDEMAAALAKKYRELKDLGLSDDEISKEMAKELNVQLADRGISLSTTAKEKLISQISDKLEEAEYKHELHDEILSWLEVLPGFPLSSKDGKNVSRNVNHWFAEVKELMGGNKSQNQILTDKLAKKILHVKSCYLEGRSRRKQLQHEIGSWLEEVSTQKYVQLNNSSKDNYINNLMKVIEGTQYKESSWDDSSDSNKIESRSRSPNQTKVYMTNDSDKRPIHSSKGDYKQKGFFNKLGKSIKIPGSRASTSTQRPSLKIERKIQGPTDLYYVEETTHLRNGSRKDSLEVDETLEELSKDLDERTQKKITSAIANNLEILNTPDAVKLRDELTSILKAANLTHEETRILSKKIIRAARIKGKCTGINVPRSESAIKEEVRDKIKEILNINKVTQHRKSIESNVTNFITSQIMADKDIDKEGVCQPLKASGLPDDKVNDMADTIIQAVRSIPLNENRQLPWTAMEKDAFKEKTALEMENLMNGITGNLTPEDKTKIQEAIARVNDKIADILSDTNLSEEEKQALVREELLQELQGLPISSEIPIEELAYQLTGKVMKIADGAKHSTPRGSWDESLSKQTEQEYLNQVIETIDKWAKILPIDPDILANDFFHETVTRDLACDIVDRQKYLQLHPESKRSDADEMEHMKYQTYRWLNKFLEPKDLNKAVAKVPSLMEALKRIPVPQLIRPGKHMRSKLGKGVIPSFQEALEDEISIWIDEQPPSLISTNDENTKQKLVKELASKVQAHKGRCTAEENIRNDVVDWLPKVFSNASSAELNRMQEELQRLLRNKGFTNDSWVPNIDTSQFIGDNLCEVLTNWIRKMPFYQKRNSHERHEQETLMMDLCKALKSLVDYSTGEGLEEQFIDEVSRRLKDIVMDEEIKNDDMYLRKVAQQMFDYLKNQHMMNQGCCSSLPSNHVLEDVVDDWMIGIQICPRTCQQKHQLDCQKKHFITCLQSVRQQYDVTSCQHEPSMKSVIDQFLRSIVDPCRRYDELYLSGKTNELLRHLRTVPIDSDGSLTVYVPKIYKKPTDVLFEDVDKWCKDLPIYVGDNPEDQEKIQTLKHNVACKIVNKVGELNMNPEIFNDEFLYEDLLADEVDKIIEDLPGNPELNKYLPALKMDLICKIKEARQRIRDDLAGKAYKQQLRDVVSSSIHLSECLNSEEEASFEILKDNLADAYISLHFVTDNEDERNKFKKKIYEEISRFCQKFLRRHPASPVDPKKINRDLYCALQRIPIPRDESMKSGVEQSRAKDVINDWLKDLRLKDESGTGLLHRNKMATVLAKRVQEIETEKESNPLLDHEKKIVDEATKFLRKLSLGSHETKIPEWAEMLKCRLKFSEKTRKFDINRPVCAQSQTGSVCISQTPLCGLSADDRAQLQTVKDRFNRPCFKDASVCAPPQDACSQANLRCWDSSPCQRLSTSLKNSACQTKSRSNISINDRRDACSMTPVYTPTQSGYEIAPRVVVKEYLWDSTHTSRPCYHSSPSACVGTQHQPSSCPNSFISPRSPCVDSQPVCGGIRPHPSSCVGIQQGQSFTEQILPCSSGHHPKQKACKCTSTQSQESVCPRKTSPRYNPQRYRSAEPEDSSEEYQDVDYRSCRHPHVTRLGSFDSDVTCGKSRRKTKKRDTKHRHDEETGWSDHDRYAEDADFWGSRARFCRTPSEQDSCVRHQERREEKVKCKCKERILTTRKGKNNQTKVYHDACTACGTKCPHPSHMYFK